MNRYRYKLIYQCVIGLVIALGTFGNVALATSSYFNNLDKQCAALNGAGAVRNASVSCTTCHNNSYVKNSIGNAYAGAGRKPTTAISAILCSLPSIPNTAPTANAGPDQSVSNALPVTITLNGTGTDKEGDVLTFKWSLTEKPAGSQATLSSAIAATPTFSADIAGQYVVQLVVNDGKLNSAADLVAITVGTAGNTPPVAHAGLDQHVLPGTLVTLNGTGSDANNDQLTYRWVLEVPSGSSATLSDATALMPTFTADVPGLYRATLIVNDGKADSAPDSVAITAGAGNTAPVANAGPDQNALLDQNITLNGSGFDADQDPLTYQWSFTKKPAGSTAILSDPTLAAPAFIADKVGEYVVQLIVNDEMLDSNPDTVLIKVSNPPSGEVNVNLALNVVPSTLTVEEFGRSVALQINISVLNNVAQLNIPVLVNASVKKPGGTMQTIGQKRISLKNAYKLYGQYTPKIAGKHTINVVISDQAGKKLTGQSKDLTVILQDDSDDDEGHDNHHKDHSDDDD